MSSSNDISKYDPALISVLQDSGSINQFLHVIFGFLMRKTDFYRPLTEDNPKLGFPEGVAESMVSETFKFYQKTMNANLDKVLEAEKIQKEISSKPAVHKSALPKVEKPLGAPQSTRSTDGDGYVYSADSECYNGARREHFTWSQKIKELDILLKMPQDVNNSKQFKIKFNNDSLLVQRAADGTPIFDEKFTWKVKSCDATWSYEKSSNQVTISVDKVEERWWDSLFVSEEKIDTQKIDCTRPMTDLGEEAQAKIAQMKFDQEQKRKGLPTSEESKIHDILKKSWDAEGSPFKGQPFDLSKINLQTSNSSF